MPRTIIPIREYPDELPCDSEPHGADPGWFRHEFDMDAEERDGMVYRPSQPAYSEREIERSQAMIAALFGPEEMARLNEGFFDDDECGGYPDLRRSARPTTPHPARSRRLPIAYWIALGFFLSIGIILGFLWLYVSSLEATAPATAPLPPSPAALHGWRLA